MLETFENVKKQRAQIHITDLENLIRRGLRILEHRNKPTGQKRSRNVGDDNRFILRPNI